MTSPQGWLRAVVGIGFALGSVLVHAQQKAKAAQLAVPPCTAQENYAPLCGFHGPEDIEVLPDGRHAIVSELPANMKHSDLPGLLLVDIDSHQVGPLPVDVKGGRLGRSGLRRSTAELRYAWNPCSDAQQWQAATSSRQP